MHIHELLQEKFPVRNSKKQKELFAKWATEYAKKQGWTAQVVRAGRKKEHANIVIGDPDTAKVIYTAHYDTPRTLFFPNLMMPTAKILPFLYVFAMVLPYVLLALVTKVLALKFGCTENVSNVIMLAVYFCTFIGMFCFGPVNKHNANDNTSGDAVILSIMAGLSPKAGKQTAFILFDNEEKGKLGSKAFAKENPLIQGNTMVVNLDCVANGEHFLFTAEKEMDSDALYQQLKNSQPLSETFSVHYFTKKEAFINSDHVNFEKGIGVAACRQCRWIKFITGRIHTSRDTIARKENMDYLSSWLIGFSESLTA